MVACPGFNISFIYFRGIKLDFLIFLQKPQQCIYRDFNRFVIQSAHFLISFMGYFPEKHVFLFNNCKRIWEWVILTRSVVLVLSDSSSFLGAMHQFRMKVFQSFIQRVNNKIRTASKWLIPDFFFFRLLATCAGAQLRDLAKSRPKNFVFTCFTQLCLLITV